MRQQRDRKYLIIFFVVWAVQMAAAFYFCTQKQGFHEDEYYTYYSTARTNGFYVEDGQWMDREDYWNEFVVLPDQRFQYGLVKLVQSWDVHPPMYYWVFHTAASLVPGVFSKWIGLSVNLVFHGINIILLTYLSYLAGGRDKRIALFVTLFYGLSPAAMSGVVFIRMYEMLTVFVLLCAVLHVRAAQAGGEKLSLWKNLVPMGIVTYIGFLTQYYYVIFLFYLAVAFCLWLLRRDRNICNCLRYGLAQGAALGLAYLTYPSCLGQMFRGQRGAQATENFLDLSNTWERLWFFGGLMNRYAFGHLLLGCFLLALLLAAAVYGRGKGKGPAGGDGQWDMRARWQQGGACVGAGYWMLVFAAAGYFLTVSKTALLLGETSNRYQLPVYGITVFVVMLGIRMLWRRAVLLFDLQKQTRTEADGRVTERAAVLLCMGAVVVALCVHGVVFLYPEDREQTDFAKMRAAEDVPAVYLYLPGEEWCVWDVADELFAYPAVYFAEAKGEELIADERIESAEALAVYLAKGADEEGQIGRVFDSNEGLSEYRVMFEEKYCEVYYFY